MTCWFHILPKTHLDSSTTDFFWKWISSTLQAQLFSKLQNVWPQIKTRWVVLLVRYEVDQDIFRIKWVMAPWGSGFQLEGGIVLKKQTKATSTCDIFDIISITILHGDISINIWYIDWSMFGVWNGLERITSIWESQLAFSCHSEPGTTASLLQLEVPNLWKSPGRSDAWPP